MSGDQQLKLISAAEVGHAPSILGTGGQPGITCADASQILTKATGFMGEYDFTLNPHFGCGFGCTYCYAAFFARDADKRDS